MHASDRLHYMDNLRALAMLAGVLFHAALAYSPLAHGVFPTADRESSIVVDVFAWFLHLFRMPLFFVVAGFFTALLVQRKGLAGMFRNRLLRIALPFVLFWPLIHASLKWLTLQAAENAVHPSPLLALIRQLMQMEDLPSLPPGTSHLWFLYYLMFFYVLVWVSRAFELDRFASRLSTLNPLWWRCLLPLLLTPALASVSGPHPAPESFLPQFWAIAFYGVFFGFGHLLHGAPAMIDRIKPHTPWLLGASVVLYGLLLTAFNRTPAELAGATAPWPVALAEAAISVWMTLACLVLGRSWLDRHNGLLRYMADVSYWTYIAHLPILFVVQYQLMDVELHWTGKFGISVALTMAICLASHEILVRRTVLARLLGGRHPPPTPAAASG